MDVLSFYIDSQYAALGKNTVLYLIDAGHDVYIDAAVYPAYQANGLGSHHNLHVIEPLGIDRAKVHHRIVFGNEPLQEGDISFALFLSDHNFHLQTRLFQHHTSYLLQEHNIPFLEGNTSFEDLLTLFTELCIDSVIDLSRYGDEALTLLAQDESTSVFGDFLAYEQERNAYFAHKTIALNDAFFELNSIQSDAPQAGRGQLSVSLPTKLQDSDLEVFSLALMMIASGHQAAFYPYDIEKADGQIRKWISLRPTDSFSQIAQACRAAHYALADNILFACLENPNRDEPSTAVTLISSQGKPSVQSPLCIYQLKQEQKLVVEYDKSFVGLSSLTPVFQDILAAFQGFKDNGKAISQLFSLPERYLKSICQDWNSTYRPYQDDTTLIGLFEKQVKCHPNKTALTFKQVTLSYAELNSKANRLAHWMQTAYNLQAKQFVALSLSRGPDLIVSLLAVLKAGCAYVPLDLAYPDSRVAYILSDSKADILLCDHPITLETSATLSVIDLSDETLQSQLEMQSSENPISHTLPSDLCYAIYTSGTTGKPKGTLLEHRNVINLLEGIQLAVDFSAEDVLLAVTTIAFDIAGLEIYMPLLNGASIVLTEDNANLNIPGLIDLITQHQVTYLQATPSLWSLIAEKSSDETSKVTALVGGEALPQRLAQHLGQQCHRVFNVYGPTETCIWSTISEIKPNDSMVRIGRPIANTQCYILDEQQRPVMIGAVGELHIAGEGVARGYLNQAALTQAHFLDNPFSTDSAYDTSKLYKTGDLARWSDTGEIEYLGRNDFQVKIRGFRIELAEIENAISSLEGIDRCVVISDNALEKQILLAYYTGAEALDDIELQAALRDTLTDYMIPNVFIHLDSMPLTVNGKLDRKALPRPIASDERAGQAESPMQAKLITIWTDILPLAGTTVSIFDDFFHLGGNSILAIQLVNRINAECQSDINISDIFNERNIKALSALVESSVGQFIYQDFRIAKANVAALYEAFPLTNVQQTYYLGRFDSFELSNVSTHVYTEYRYATLDVSRLEQAFNRLLVRHPALRTVFSNDRQQFVEHYPAYQIACHEIHNEADFLAIRDALSHKLYQADQYPLFDIVVSQFEDHTILHISFDAIIIDMSSFQILFQEWIALYREPDATLDPIDVTYRDYVIQYNKIRSSHLYQQAQAYWANKVDDYQFEWHLPLKNNPADITKPRFKRLSRTIPNSTWQKLLSKVQAHNISPTIVILELYARVLAYWSGQTQLSINLTLFNRLPLHADIEKVIGDFTVLSLFNYQHQSDLSLLDKFKQSHRQLLEDIAHNLFDGIDFQRLIKQKRHLPAEQILAPVVLTSVLGFNEDQGSLFHLPIDESYEGIHYGISQTSQVWLDNKAYETANGFVAEWDYVDDLFEPELIEAMHTHYCELIAALAELDWQAPASLPLSLPKPSQDVIDKANDTAQAYEPDTLFAYYEKQLASEPGLDRIAVVDVAKDQQWSHRDVLAQSHKLCLYLLAQSQTNPKPAPLVAILSEKGSAQVIASLAIMKAGYAYLPLHVDWPVGRLDEVMSQGGVEICLLSRQQFNNATLKSALEKRYRLLVIEDCLAEIDSDTNLLRRLEQQTLPTVTPSDVAYVIFTSGSTGKPKGVTISHQGALNTILAINNSFAISADDSVLALSELSFDLSVYDLFGVLAAGGQIVFPDQAKTKEPEHWVNLVERHQISLWNTVPQLAGLLVDAATATQLSSLRLYLLSGDWIPTTLPNKLKTASPDATVMSLGGATEGSIWSIWYRINEVKSDWQSIPYGTAMPNQTMTVLQDDLSHCPIGVRGEIHIGGDGVALNYWGDEALTRERFIDHPTLGRLYKTGDLGRWSADGVIEFMGRRDFQVKLNGYRVELEEIALKIKSLPGVSEAIVRIQQEKNGNHVLAYLVPDAPIPEANPDKDTEQSAFKLAQYGLIQSQNDGYTLPVQCDERSWRQRKSYRVFQQDDLDIDLIHACYADINSQAQTALSHHGQQSVSTKSLATVLSRVSAMTLSDKTLPKYLYPSSGSCYAVRCFVSLVTPCDDLSAGLYYYHPVQHQLHKIEDEVMVNACTQEENAICLVANWPAIEPLYAAHADKLVKLEAGHMLSLLSEASLGVDWSYQIDVKDKAIDRNNTLIARLNLSATQNKFDSSPMALELDCYVPLQQAYCNREGDTILALGEQALFKQCSAYTSLLNSGKAILSLRGENRDANLVLAGFVFQRLSEALYESNIGSTTLGFPLYQDNIYSILFGVITDEDKAKSEMLAQPRQLRDVANTALANSLPNYMLPSAYFVLNELPLTANGKLDSKQLPKLQFEEKRVVLTDEREIAVAEVIAKVLSIELDQIAAEDNFFRLGGNSLLAMKLLRELNQTLGLKLSLVELYKINCVSAIASRLKQESVEQQREEGVL